MSLHRPLRRFGPLPRPLVSAASAPFAPRALAALLYAVVALPLAVTSLLVVLVGLVVGGAMSVTAIGPWLLALTVRAAAALGAAQRAVAGRLLGVSVAAPPQPASRVVALLGWRRAVLRDRAGWRAVAFALAAPLTALLPVLAAAAYVYGVLFLLHPLLKRWNYHHERGSDGVVRRVSLSVAGVQFDTWPRWPAVVLAGVVLLVLAPWLLRRALVPQRLLLRTLLGPSASEERIRALEETRAHAVEDAAAVLRRIERDLHDGTQARLVGLGMQLTVIAELLGADAGREQVLAVVDKARGSAKQAVAELRDLVRGIHPPVLDQGLEVALDTLAAGSALPVRLTTDLPRRPPAAIESIAYFCAAELLTNVVKHSGAAAAWVDVRGEGGVLHLSVRDDGHGGAVIGGGTGLRGLRARVRTVDGTLTCDSPAGGPTMMTVELPYP